MYNELIVIYITNAVSYILQRKVFRLKQKPKPSDVKCLQRGRRLIACDLHHKMAPSELYTFSRSTFVFCFL
jgi:hypothetical protein